MHAGSVGDFFARDSYAASFSFAQLAVSARTLTDNQPMTTANIIATQVLLLPDTAQAAYTTTHTRK